MNSAPVIQFQFDGEVWFYKNPNAVYFVSSPAALYDEILDVVGTSLNPWGTVPVDATIGEFTWYSSMFPRKERRCYDLPLNARVRKRLGLEAGAVISVAIAIPIPR